MYLFQGTRCVAFPAALLDPKGPERVRQGPPRHRASRATWPGLAGACDRASAGRTVRARACRVRTGGVSIISDRTPPQRPRCTHSRVRPDAMTRGASGAGSAQRTFAAWGHTLEHSAPGSGDDKARNSMKPHTEALSLLSVAASVSPAHSSSFLL